MTPEDELAALLAQHAIVDGEHSTPVAGVTLFRASSADMPLPSVYRPCLCFIAQGSKQVMLGQAIYRYRPGQYPVVSIDLPMINLITAATPRSPYLLLRMDIDPQQIADILLQAPHLCETVTKPPRGLFIGRSDEPLIDGIVRLARLFNTPEDIPILAAQTLREILYRVLAGEDGRQVAQLALNGSILNRIARIITTLKTHFDQPLSIAALAQMADMSVSTFHAHFKSVTAMSPLQYQKSLRLIEARALMLSRQWMSPAPPGRWVMKARHNLAANMHACLVIPRRGISAYLANTP
ncbi:AraC family transcriptional regulator [Sodalis praecaptivus]|uniref:AraC family transcriptional regulator n=1 Tax=Sodalis praecaptivus TaxID=1239307 RepID=UPI0027F2171F|nr:AraC family transcriptional regulator [Sodalis praecaptivus]CAJ0991965.1 hypothetical protein NVIRENTERO_00477 [Sodalis praecaptivus]